jgi:outer membrane immunogenic protein
MKRILCGIAILAIGVCGHAYAADMPVKAPPAPPPLAFSWTGFYAGLNAGYGWGETRQTYTGDVAGTPQGAGNIVLNLLQNITTFPASSANNPLSLRDRSSGFAGGGQLGFNKQFDPKWVAGIETDLQFADLKGSSFFAPQPPGGVTFSLTENDRLKWFGTTRGRLGYLPTERLMLFGTAGVAYGRTSDTTAIANTSAIGFLVGGGPTTIFCPASAVCLANAESHTEVGWTAGGGIEYAVTNAVSLKVEYLHVDLGSQTFRLVAQQPQVAPSTGNGFVTAKYENDYNIVRVGVNAKFSGL